jgi:hypothetical protein
MDIIREILLAVEAAPAGEIVSTFNIESASSGEELVGHLRLAKDAGFFEGTVSLPYADGGHVAITGLTNAGHDFLDTIRSEEVWGETKQRIGKIGGTVSIEILKSVAAAIATKIVMGG